MARNWLITSAAFSWDIARSTLGSRTSPALTEATPAARASICSTKVILSGSFRSFRPSAHDPLQAFVFSFDSFFGQIAVLEAAIFLKADEIGELLEGSDPLSLAGEKAGGGLFEGGKEVGEGLVGHHDRGHGNRNPTHPHRRQFRDRHQLGFHS